MITRIEIDGFKTFKDFSVELAPFQVIVGPNGSGKSNLFDALHLLSRLADNDLTSAFQELRGEVGELFTILPDGKAKSRMHLAIEMLVNRKIQGVGEAWQEEETVILEKKTSNRSIPLQYARFRYELEITLGTDTYGLERLYLTHESLKSIPEIEDKWCERYGLSFQNKWLPEPKHDRKVFIDTKLTPVAIVEARTDRSTSVVEQPMIYLYPDSDEQEKTRRFYANEVQQTVISRVTDIEHPHILAIHDELLSLRFFHLNPEALRQSGLTKGSRYLSHEGGNLPTTLARIRAEDSFAFHLISLEMGNLVPDILKIKVEQDKTSDKYVIIAETSDGRSFPSRLLSDGTLRLLALATLRNDPQFHGVICLEEPENGVDPLHLKNMARLLREMATDFSDPEQANEPLRQVFITTHSSTFISQPDVLNSLLFAHTISRVVPHKYSMEITVMIPVITPTNHLLSATKEEVDKSEENYTIDQVQKYLDRSTFEEAQSQLEQARAALNEG